MRPFLIAAIGTALLLPAAAMAHPDPRPTRIAWAGPQGGPAAAQGPIATTRAVVQNRIIAGMRLEPAAYARSRAITKPGRYHLARAGTNMRWVRIQDDAVLVNLKNGRVVTAVYRTFG